MGGSGAGGALSGPDGIGGGGVGQGQPTNEGVSEVEPVTPVEDCAPNDFDCQPQKNGFKAPGGGDPEPPDTPKGPEDFTL